MEKRFRIKISPIETERLILRKFTMDDIDDYIEYRSNEHIYDYQPSSIKNSREEYAAELQNKVNGYRKRKLYTKIWAVVLKDENKVIGSVGLGHYHAEYKFGELFWQISVDYQKKGYAFEAMRALINYLFKECGTNRVQAFVWQGNKASEALARKLGFMQEGVERQSRMKNGKYLDRLEFGLLREEWETLKIYKD